MSPMDAKRSILTGFQQPKTISDSSCVGNMIKEEKYLDTKQKSEAVRLASVA